MPDNTALIKQLEAELKAPLPTPRVSDPVIWYPANKQESPVAAIVGAIEAAGRVALIVFQLNAHPKTVKGVHHVSWPEHQRVGNVNTTMYGSWDYPSGKPPARDFDKHTAQLEAKLAKAKADHVLPQKELATAK